MLAKGVGKIKREKKQEKHLLTHLVCLLLKKNHVCPPEKNPGAQTCGRTTKPAAVKKTTAKAGGPKGGPGRNRTFTDEETLLLRGLKYRGVGGVPAWAENVVSGRASSCSACERGVVRHWRVARPLSAARQARRGKNVATNAVAWPAGAWCNALEGWPAPRLSGPPKRREVQDEPPAAPNRRRGARPARGKNLQTPS